MALQSALGLVEALLSSAIIFEHRSWARSRGWILPETLRLWCQELVGCVAFESQKLAAHRGL
jgi:hypothetical protein